MPTSLRRSLYIGLGGTGISAILHTKKMYLETYGEIPPMIGFLGIDTDKNGFEKKLDAFIDGKIETVELDQFEKGIITVSDPSKVYEREQNDLLDWFPEKTIPYLRSLENGAGQIRANGRLGLLINADNIRVAIKNRIDNIRDPRHQTNQEYRVVDNSKDEIHMIFSVCGGTGAGTFIDVAYMAKLAAGSIGGNNSAKIIGYALLPDVFKAMYPVGPAMKNVKANAYASVYDLDYLMHLDNTSNKVIFKHSKTQRKIETNETPFSSVILVDNKNSNRETYTKVEQLTEMLSVTLFLAAGEFGNNGASVLDNIEAAKDVTKVKNKKSWVSYLGACEILFKGNEIADVYAKQAIHVLIQKLLSNNKDSTANANAWINAVKIREHLSDDLIDSICPANLSSPMEDIDPDKADEEIKTFFNLVVPNEQTFSAKENAIRARVISELEVLIHNNINDTESPVLSTLNTLTNIAEQVKVFKTEMENEMDQLTKAYPVLESQLATSLKELNKIHSKTIKIFIGRKKIELQDTIRELVHKMAINKIELKRRIVAKNIYDALNEELQKSVNRVREIIIIMENVDKATKEELAKLINYANKKTNIFDIDLGTEFVTTLSINEREILIRDFINSLPGNNLYSIGSQDALKQQMENYTKTLPQTRIYEEMTIDERMAQISEENFEKLIRLALAKANPLIDIDKQGYLEVNDSVAKQFFIGVYRQGTNRVETDTILRDNLESSTLVEYIPTGMRDRVVFYRLEGPMPAFAVSSIMNSCESDYKMYMDDRNAICPNFDKNLLENMIMEEHSLMPSDERNIALKYWVMGFVLGFLRRRQGNYYYRDISKIGMGAEWVSLQSKKRTNAYIEFRKQIGKLQPMYDAYISDEMRADAPKIRNLVADANSMHLGRMKYFNEIADCEANRQTITGPGYGNIRELIEQEEEFVKNNLLNVVESFL